MKHKLIDEDATYRFTKVKKEDNYSEWHTQLCNAAGILDNRYLISGMSVMMPYGYKISMNIQGLFRKEFEKTGAEETYFPLIVPFEYLKKNEMWLKSFQYEGYKVHTESEEGVRDDIGWIRPTGEPAMYPMFSLWVRSKNDLPIKVFQVCQNYRNEKTTRPLLRPREFLWNEVHCAFATRQEVDAETKLHLSIEKKVNDLLAIPNFVVEKPEWDVFAGAISAYELYSITADGRCLEIASVNNLGQAYSKRFDVKFTDDKGKEDYAWIVCTGSGPRHLASLMSYHGDDKGLVIHPLIAPIQAIIIPIISTKESKKQLNFSNKVMNELEKAGIRTDVDDRNISTGRKFYDWEVKGVPLRIEIGEREVSNNSVTIVNRITSEKKTVKLTALVKSVNNLLNEVHEQLAKKAKTKLNSCIKQATKIDEINNLLDNKKTVKMYWCKNKACYNNIESKVSGIDLFGTDIKESVEGNCINCNNKTRTILYGARKY